MNRVYPFLLIVFLAASSPATASNWPGFRGPTGDGIVPALPEGKLRNLPMEWSDDKNVAWKTPIPGRAWSTPVVWGSQVWLTNATEDGKKMYAVCLDRSTGAILHNKLLFENEKPAPLGNKVNGYGSPSPYIEDGRVYIHFGSYGTACLDTKTAGVIWERRDLPCRHYRGPASSVVKWKDTIILSMDGVDAQYVVALDAATGKNVWKTDRATDWKDIQPDGSIAADGDRRKAFATPAFVSVGGKTQMISTASTTCFSYDPDSGEEIWRVTYPGHSSSSSPIAMGDDMVFVNSGFGKAHLLGVRLDPKAKGDITKSHVEWDVFKRVPNRSSPVLVGEHLYITSEMGVVSCVEAKTGNILWDGRIRGHFSASPIYAEGHVYFCSEQGDTFVIKPNEKELKVVATNRLGEKTEGFMASPVIAGNALFLRSKTHLYRVEKLPEVAR